MSKPLKDEAHQLGQENKILCHGCDELWPCQTRRILDGEEP